ncbi:hypothetical protein BDN67DRAFT_968199 [Paxillus ammoniavirescens]|nr:hypothetical protein BDN67DRAFT_968199 [Paxillus ammoniavirescens]
MSRCYHFREHISLFLFSLVFPLLPTCVFSDFLPLPPSLPSSLHPTLLVSHIAPNTLTTNCVKMHPPEQTPERNDLCDSIWLIGHVIPWRLDGDFLDDDGSWVVDDGLNCGPN